MRVSFFLQQIKDLGIRTIAGVPDSTLKQFCDAVQLDDGENFKHYVTANEGAAVALATGEYLATNHPSLVYLQNSGLGNIINPLVSIANQEVYAIPMLFIVGWRGEPGKKDEPQHIYQGKITCELLSVMGVPYSIIDEETSETQMIEVLKDAKDILNQNRQYAVVVKRGTFEKCVESVWNTNYKIIRERALKLILENIYSDSYIISTTGKISRELYEQSDRLFNNHDRIFMTVGGWGMHL